MGIDPRSFIVTLSCPDTAGIVVAVTHELSEHGALITEAHQYRDPLSNSTILRIVFQAGSATPLDIERFPDDFAVVATRFGMKWKVHDSAQRLKVLVAVSRQGHCLKSMLHRSPVTISLRLVLTGTAMIVGSEISSSM
jgi:formyltetrahydrofolate deformylase